MVAQEIHAPSREKPRHQSPCKRNCGQVARDNISPPRVVEWAPFSGAHISMNAAKIPASKQREDVDLASLGKHYRPPEQADTSPEVADVIARIPPWAARGLI